MLDITVKTLDSNNHNFSVDDDMNVADFKAHIASTVQLPQERQRLIHCGRVLQDDRLLSDYSLHGKAVHLVQRPPPSRHPASTSTSDRNHQSAPHPRVSVTPLLVGAISVTSSAQPMGGAEVRPLAPGAARLSTSSSGTRLAQARSMIQLANAVIDSFQTGRPLPSDWQTPLPSSVMLATPATASSVAAPGRSVETGATLQPIRDRLPVGAERVSAGVPPVANGTSVATVVAHPGAVICSRVVEMLLALLERLTPHLRWYQRLLAEDRPLHSADQLSAANSHFQHTAEAVHYAAHVMHLISDMTVDLSQAPPRHMRARPVMFTEHRTVTAGLHPINLDTSRAGVAPSRAATESNASSANVPTSTAAAAATTTTSTTQAAAASHSNVSSQQQQQQLSETPMETDDVPETSTVPVTSSSSQLPATTIVNSFVGGGGGSGGMSHFVQAFQENMSNIAMVSMPGAIHADLHQAAVEAAQQAAIHAARDAMADATVRFSTGGAASGATTVLAGGQPLLIGAPLASVAPQFDPFLPCHSRHLTTDALRRQQVAAASSSTGPAAAAATASESPRLPPVSPATSAASSHISSGTANRPPAALLDHGDMLPVRRLNVDHCAVPPSAGTADQWSSVPDSWRPVLVVDAQRISGSRTSPFSDSYLATHTSAAAAAARADKPPAGPAARLLHQLLQQSLASAPASGAAAAADADVQQLVATGEASVLAEFSANVATRLLNTARRDANLKYTDADALPNIHKHMAGSGSQ